MSTLNEIKSIIIERAINSKYEINIENYTKAVDWLFAPENKNIVSKCIHEQFQIDYPSYFEMPKDISDNLSSSELELLQEFVPFSLTDYYKQELQQLQKLYQLQKTKK